MVFTIRQAAAACDFSVSPSSIYVGSTGGTGTITVTASASCTWESDTSNSWITILSGSYGAGSGSVRYVIEANTGGQSRSGAITVGGSIISVTQGGGSEVSVSPDSAYFANAGGQGTIAVAASSSCAWEAETQAPWITFSESSGTGSGTVKFSVDANSGQETRTGTITVAGASFMVGQAGASLSSKVYIPHITGGEDNWKDTLEIDNTSGAEGTYQIVLFDAQGNVVGENTSQIGAWGYAAIEVKNIADSAVCGTIYYSSEAMNFRISYENTGGGGVAQFNLSPDAESSLSFYFANFSPIVQWKGLAVMNTSGAEQEITLKAYGGGALLATATAMVPPSSRISNVAQAWFPELTIAEVERIEATAENGALSGISITGNDQSSSMLFTPATSLGGVPGTAIIPHVTGGEDNWTDFLEIDNLSQAGGSFEIALYDYTGTQVYRGTHNAQGYAYEVIRLKDLADSAVCGTVRATSGALAYRVSYENESGGVAEFLLNTKTGADLDFFFANSSPIVEWKGLAVMNAGQAAAEVNLTAYGSGQSLATATAQIPAMARISNVVEGFFPQLTASQVQRVEISTSSPDLSGISISGNQDSSKMLFTPARP